jgi:hypothetical protein
MKTSFLKYSDVLEFVEKYNKAEKEKAESFFFQDSEVLTSYAYYLIQYTNSRLSIGKFDGKQFVLTNKSQSNDTGAH